MPPAKKPIRVDPFAAFASGEESYSGTKVGIIRDVDYVNMKASVDVTSGGRVPRFEIDLTQAMAGPRSFWGGVPEVGSTVHIGYRRINRKLYEAVILGYIPVGQRTGMRFDPYAANRPADVDPADATNYAKLYGRPVRYKRLMLRPGEVGGMSAAGAELVLSKDVRMCNRAGDLFELRDSDRTLVSQSIHRVESDCGSYVYSGPVRRNDFYLPPEIFKEDGRTLKDNTERYFGRKTLQGVGPGTEPGGEYKFSNASGKVLDKINNEEEFPSVTFSNGRRTHYVAFSPEALEGEEGARYAFTERRMEMPHVTDLVQDVLGDIDGFSVERRTPFIQQVFGTLVGKDLSSTMGLRQYGKILKPRIFEGGAVSPSAAFALDEVDRGPLGGDIEANTMAGAYLLRIMPPRGSNENAFACSVSKQGKLFLNVPASQVENAERKAISAELNFEGGIMAHIGATKPDRLSLDLHLDGGVRVVFGGTSSTGQVLDLEYRGSVKQVFAGQPDDDGFSKFTEVKGNYGLSCAGDLQETVGGSRETNVNGNHLIRADRTSISAISGHTLNCGELNTLVSGKSQYNYALAVLENIVAGGKLSTIMAGGQVDTVLAGAVVKNVLGGAMTTNVAAGAYTVSVGAGAIAITTGAGAVSLATGAGAVSIAAGAGAVSITAGLAMNLAASVAVSVVAPQILHGGPAAVLGVARGAPALPPGVPTLCWITGQALLGSAINRSI